MTIRLKIRKHDDDHIALEALSGIDHFGFGTFLCKIKPDEIDCDEFSKAALCDASDRDGLQGLEIWPDNRIAWGDPNHTIIMPIKEINNQGAAWLKDLQPTDANPDG